MATQDTAKQPDEQRAEQGRRALPWRAILKNVAAAGLGTGVGYIAGGLTHRALLKGLPGRQLYRLSPAAREKVLRRAMAGTGAALGLGLTLKNMASMAHIEDEREEAERRSRGEKVAMLSAYAAPLRTP